MVDVGLLLLRVTLGTLLMGHGTQKLFGWFSGPGFRGTSGFLESLNMRPGQFWAGMAGLSEAGGGLMSVLGFLNPLGPIGVISAMIMATLKAHWGKPIWASSGGAELAITNLAAASAVALAGPGRYSVDGLLKLRTPRWLTALTLLGAGTSIYFGTRTSNAAQQPAETEPATGDAEAVPTA
ncbi:MAG: DoxX family protein [Chloroflexota bacterium]